MPERNVTLSVVSHRQNALVNQLLEDVQRVCAERVALVLTENVPDSTPLSTQNLKCPVEIIVNKEVKGFGANHNAAFTRCRTPYFCVCNPDIRLNADPFPPLIETLQDPKTGVVGPLVRSPGGVVEDSARRFPTSASLLKKLFVKPGGPDYPTDRGAIEVDWVAGMFMLFRTESFAAVKGFDEAYFLYYEDADICERLRRAGSTAIFDPRAEVVHDARRESRREPQLAKHHMASALRFLGRRIFRG
jgi:N-acetylglucosaminyl-diphospho-decaprenol L-rhamnosyltransferase